MVVIFKVFESFEKEFVIYDFKKFLVVLLLFDDVEFKFEEY